MSTNAPFGFRPAKSPSGHVYANVYKAKNAVQLLEGDLVVLSTDGQIDKANSASATILGAVAASDPSSVSASVERDVLVYDDPNQIFEVQTNAATASEFVRADVGARFRLGNDSAAATGFLSDQVIDMAAESASFALKIVGLSPTVGNDFGAYGKALVKIMNHEYADV